MFRRMVSIVVVLVMLSLVGLACSPAGTGAEPGKSGAVAEQPSGQAVPGAVEQAPAAQPAAGEAGGEQPAAQAEPPKPAPTATESGPVNCTTRPPRDYIGPAPQPGTGNFYGVVLWNGAPVPNTQVEACLDANYKYECAPPAYPAVTDANGYFMIPDLLPAEYVVVVHAIDKEKWMDIRKMKDDYSDVVVQADQCVSLGQIPLIKWDFFQAAPRDKAKISDPRPVLTWDAYPDAAYYEVYLSPEAGKAIFFDERVKTNEIAPYEDLLTCSFAWKVTAFNAQSVAIAETEDFYHFNVVDQPISCYIVGNQPPSESTVTGIGVVLSWDPHPLAAYYVISMVRSRPDYEKILDYIEVKEPRYALEVTLPVGEYYWNVYAKDQFGDEVAQDQGNTYLNVK